MAGKNCWEVMKCGAEANCPAYPTRGTICWTVEGTLCRGQKQGSYQEKVGECRTKCEYYNGVMTGSIRVV